MESALVTASTGVMKPLLSKLTNLLGEEYVKLRGVRKQILLLPDELGTMSATLQMLADEEQLDPETREWRDKLRELAYDLEDCVDAFLVLDDHKKKQDGLSVFEWFFHELKKLKARHDLANQIEELKARVLETSDRHKRYGLKNKPSSSSVDPRLQALYEDIDKLVGIDDPKRQIIELLNMNESSTKLKVVSISGCGGLGKTTLAKQVYEEIKNQFECAAFVSVSRTPDVRKILIHIADGVKCTGINTQDDGEQQLIDKLREHLQDKRYLIVIDDVWDAKPWETIKHALVNKNCDSRVITTTRSNVVASYLSSQGGNVYQMKSLSFEDSKKLLFKRAFGSENLPYAHLGNTPDEILRKCDGLPLAIITISGMLVDQHTKNEWDSVLNDIGSALAKNPGAENMTAILSMSYFDIPHHLRTCLLYMSIFPEDYEIEKQRLINRWIAEGFIHEKEGQTKYEIGEGYFNDLINRNMIQPVKVKYGQAKGCRVHDIILDYIKCKADEENFVSSVDAAEPTYTSKCKVRRLCVNNNNEETVTIWEDPILSHIRSVTLFGRSVKISLLPSTAIRVLDLGDCGDMQDHHLASIENMVNLKYLRLGSPSIIKLPDNVCKLQHLQTLDVRGTYIKELPQTITKLEQLARLYVDGSARFMEGTIGNMHSLEELRAYGVQSIKQEMSIQEFSKLIKLRTLKLKWDVDLPYGLAGRRQAEHINSCVGNLLSSCNLHNLIYTSDLYMEYALSLDSWYPAVSCSIRKLLIKRLPIYRVPKWMGSLGNLSVLELMVMCVRPEDVHILGKIPSLLFLNLITYGGTNQKIVFYGNNGFRSLKYFSLVILFCGTSLEFEEGSMSKLEYVKLDFRAHKMECMNGPSSLGIQHLSSLNKADIIIRSDRHEYDGNYNPAEDDHDDTTRCVSRAISAAIESLTNHPMIRFRRQYVYCKHFESFLRELNQDAEGLLNEWLELWQIREERQTKLFK